MKTYSRSFCRVCHAAGKPRHVFQNHNIGSCSFFDGQDRKDMYASLKAMNIEEDEDGNTETWEVDDEEIESAENGQE